MQSQNDERSVFDWLIFTLIHLVVIGAIGYVGLVVYGPRLGLWVAASATVAGLASCYLFAKDVPGETLMKVWLYLCVAANAGYLAHNGAQKIGVEDYNNKQVEKFEKGMAEAGKATSRRIARELRLGAESASQLQRTLGDGVSVVVAILAFLELASALMIFAISARRLKRQKQEARQQLPLQPPPGGPFVTDAQGNVTWAQGYGPNGVGHRESNKTLYEIDELEAQRKLIDEINAIRAYQTGRLKELEGKGQR